MDAYGHINQFLAAGCDAHELPSIVGCAHNEAGDYLLARSYLVLEVHAGVGDGGRELSVGPFLAFAVGQKFSSLPTRLSLPARYHEHNATWRSEAYGLEAYAP